MFVAVATKTNEGIRARMKKLPPQEKPKPAPTSDQLMAIIRAKRKAEREKDAIILTLQAKLEMEQAKARAQEYMEKRTHTYADIERRVCFVFGISKAELHSERRHRRTVLARQAVYYWASALTELSTPAIGRLMGNRDHTTVLYGRNAYIEKRKAMGRYLKPAR